MVLKFLKRLLIVALFAVFFWIAALPFNLEQQVVFSTLLILAAHFAAKRKNYKSGLLLILTSTFLSFRYIYWRMSETLYFADGQYLSWVLVTGLLLAELYAITVMFLSYLQLSRPLKRKPVPLPEDISLWPTIDVFIPTYNEPLKVLKPTVYAAMSMDYPAHKFRVYILDDGNREEIKEFAEEAGCEYKARTDNTHAKAGNINQAFAETSGELVAIFDCDHVPVRSFLQLTAGWFLKDKKMGMLQTPHHFFSPDPYERNLKTFRNMPNENELFYGVVQDGNDLWNATFFCGSCALLSRKALKEIGGVAVETVTEDAHTALKMHRRGWNTGYINIPQAAGLATESLSAHIGQRIRWARGMVQILRIDCPLLGRGLSFMQRMCYFNAMLHFLYSVPRIVFLTAPLAYLLFGVHVIQASAIEIVAYALPHLVMATIANSYHQGKHRSSFWAEVYETTLSTYIFLPTMLALINPKLGKFNVTEKGGIVKKDSLDWNVAKHYIVLIGLNLLGFVVGIISYPGKAPDVQATILINLVWTCYNLLIIGASLAVAWESKQLRQSVRLTVNYQGHLIVAPGVEVPVEIKDISDSGMALVMQKEMPLDAQYMQLETEFEQQTMRFPIELAQQRGSNLGIKFFRLSPQEQKNVVLMMHSRADTWLNWRSPEHSKDKPMKSFMKLAKIGTECYIKLLQALAARLKKDDDEPEENTAAKDNGTGKVKNNALSSLVIVGLMSAWLFSGPVLASQNTLAPITWQQEFDTLVLDPQSGTDNKGLMYSYYFTVPKNQLAEKAEINLSLNKEKQELSYYSQLSVFVNDQLVKTIKGNALKTQDSFRFAVDPFYFSSNNKITLQLVELNDYQCTHYEYLHGLNIIDPLSSVRLQLQAIDIQSDLGHLPFPFFSPNVKSQQRINFVLPNGKSEPVLMAAGYLASWFGSMKTHEDVVYQAHLNEMPNSDFILFLTSDIQSNIELLTPEIIGPMLTVLPHPDNPVAKVLVVAGRDEAELILASRYLVNEHKELTGTTKQLAGDYKAEKREAYDAPHWLPIGEITRFSELEHQLVNGSVERVAFRYPPDVFLQYVSTVPVALELDYPERLKEIEEGFIEVGLNGDEVETLNLESDFVKQAYGHFYEQDQSYDRQVEFKVAPDTRFPVQQMEFKSIPDEESHEFCKVENTHYHPPRIDGRSGIDLRDFSHFSFLPNLNKFATAGFPFTQYADLSNTLFFIKENASAMELSSFLTILGHIGAQTGLPAYHMDVHYQFNSAYDLLEKDIFILGTWDVFEPFEEWVDKMPLRYQGSEWQVIPVPWWRTILNKMRGAEDLLQTRGYAQNLLLEASEGFAAFSSFESPVSATNTVVTLTGSSDDKILLAAQSLPNSALAQYIKGDLVIFHDDMLSSFALTPSYSKGKLDLVSSIKMYFSQNIVALTFFTLLLAYILTLIWNRSLEKRVERRFKEQKS